MAPACAGGIGGPGAGGALVGEDGQGTRGEEGAASLQPSAVSGDPEADDWEGQGRPRCEPVAEDRKREG